MMTFDDYLTFLEEYWDIFGPIPTAAPPTLYKIVKL